MTIKPADDWDQVLAIKRSVWDIDRRLGRLRVTPKSGSESIQALVSTETMQRLGVLVRRHELHARGITGLVSDLVNFWLDNYDDLPMPSNWRQRQNRDRGDDKHPLDALALRQNLPLTQRQQRIQALLLDGEQRCWSDTHLAKKAKVSQQEVSDFRRRLEDCGSIPPEPVRRYLRNGKTLTKRVGRAA